MKLGSLLVVVFLALGCGKKESGGGGDDVKWPARPADGTPVAFEFVKMVGSGDRLEGEFRLFNFEAQPITHLDTELHYLGADGKELKSFPMGLSGPSLVAGKSVATKEMGAFIPPETKTVAVEVREVTFKDGSSWKKPN